jgi:molybdopterin converting factor subunit 1
MIVKVHFFASAKDVAGSDVLDINLDEKATVGDLKKSLVERFPELESIVQRSAFSVDQEYSNEQSELHDGAEVGLIPPVSGG